MKQNPFEIKIALVEDDPVLAYSLLKMLAKTFPAVNVVSVSNTVEQAKESIDQTNPDLLILDVQLSENKNAFDLLRETNNVSSQIIFMTANPQDKIPTAICKYSIVDYLPKPLDIPRLINGIHKAKERIFSEQLLANYKKKHLEENAIKEGETPNQNIVTLNLTKGRIVKVKLDQVLRCESNGDLTKLYFTDPKKEKLVLVQSLKDCERSFRPDLFCRVHKQHLVNLQFINKVHLRNQPEIELTNGEKIPIARRRKKEVLNKFSQAQLQPTVNQ